MKIPQSYKNKVLAGFIKMKPGEIIELNPKTVGYEKFVECTKLIMDNQYDVDNKFTLIFSNDYTKLKKLQLNQK